MTEPNFLADGTAWNCPNRRATLTTMTAARKIATYADLFDLPDDVVGQILDGELHVHPRPAIPHAAAASQLGIELGGEFGRRHGSGSGGWHILDEPELHLGRQILVPDLAGWRRERVDELPKAAFFEMAPDWICEVLSPSTARIDRGRKRAIYAENGVPYLWHVDPEAHLIEVFHLGERGYVLVATAEGDESARLEPFVALNLDLRNVW